MNKLDFSAIFLLAIAVILVFSTGCQEKTDVPRGVQCALGLQNIGCDFLVLDKLGDGRFTAHCTIGGSITFSLNSCVIIEAPDPLAGIGPINGTNELVK